MEPQKCPLRNISEDAIGILLAAPHRANLRPITWVLALRTPTPPYPAQECSSAPALTLPTTPLEGLSLIGEVADWQKGTEASGFWSLDSDLPGPKIPSFQAPFPSDLALCSLN